MIADGFCLDTITGPVLGTGNIWWGNDGHRDGRLLVKSRSSTVQAHLSDPFTSTLASPSRSPGFSEGLSSSSSWGEGTNLISNGLFGSCSPGKGAGHHSTRGTPRGRYSTQWCSQPHLFENALSCLNQEAKQCRVWSVLGVDTATWVRAGTSLGPLQQNWFCLTLKFQRIVTDIVFFLTSSAHWFHDSGFLRHLISKHN